MNEKIKDIKNKAEELAKSVQDEAYVKYIEEQALKNFIIE